MIAHHAQYAAYVARHKVFVALAGRALGLSWPRLLVHDWTKFLACEWFPYVDHFHGSRAVTIPAAGYRHQPGANPAFDLAWEHHWRSNAHHWQHWIIGPGHYPRQIPTSQRAVDDQRTVCAMPEDETREMVADWIGAGLAQGKPAVSAWYTTNGAHMVLHPETRARVEALLASYAYGGWPWRRPWHTILWRVCQVR